jgi:hypothetical protein
MPTQKSLECTLCDSDGEWRPACIIRLTRRGSVLQTLAKPALRTDTSWQDLIEQIKRRQWGIIVLDEVHLSFAEKFWQVRCSERTNVMTRLFNHVCVYIRSITNTQAET